MEVSGAAGEIASVVSGPLAALGPHGAVAGFYLLTAAFTEVMSNNAGAAVFAPVAMGAAEQLALNPYALLVTVMFGASASFLTPIGYQTNALVYAPGGYRFRDFLRVGLPLHLLLVGVAGHEAGDRVRGARVVNRDGDAPRSQARTRASGRR